MMNETVCKGPGAEEGGRVQAGRRLLSRARDQYRKFRRREAGICREIRRQAAGTAASGMEKKRRWNWTLR